MMAHLAERVLHRGHFLFRGYPFVAPSRTALAEHLQKPPKIAQQMLGPRDIFQMFIPSQARGTLGGDIRMLGYHVWSSKVRF